MNFDWKKIGLIFLLVLATAALGFLIYFFIWRPLLTPTEEPTPTNLNQEEPDQGQLPITININGRIFNLNLNQGLPDQEPEISVPSGQEIPDSEALGKITKIETIIPKPTRFSSFDENNLIYYDPGADKFRKISANGEISDYHRQLFYNVQEVSWSPDRRRAILEYPDGSNILYDFETDRQITLPKHWQNFSFSGNGQEIAFKSIGLDEENRYLTISRPDGSQPRILESIGGVEDQFDPNWSPSGQIAATFTKSRDYDRSEVYFIGQHNENFKMMIVEGRDFRGKWSPDGQKILYSVYSSRQDYRPQLWISNAVPGDIGANRKFLNLQTWVEKCSFADKTKIYCAAPKELPFGIGLEPEQAKNISDQIYEINLKTGTQKLIAIPEKDLSVSKILISPNSRELFLTDSRGRIHKIKL